MASTVGRPFSATVGQIQSMNTSANYKAGAKNASPAPQSQVAPPAKGKFVKGKKKKGKGNAAALAAHRQQQEQAASAQQVMALPYTRV